MEQLTYTELKDKANKELNELLQDIFNKKGMRFTPFKHSQKDIFIWAILNGYKKQRIQKDKERKIYYIKD